jgi:hypothetical protein
LTVGVRALALEVRRFRLKDWLLAQKYGSAVLLE